MTDENLDGLSELSEILAIRRSGYHRHEGDNGLVAIFPSVKFHAAGSAEQRALEVFWEQRTVEMHQAQLPVTLEAKPETNSLLERQTARGD